MNSWLPVEGRGIVKDIGNIMYTLLYFKWITNKNLLYSTWNSAQCYVAAWMGGGLGQNGYMCMAESLHCSSKTITTLLTGYTPVQNVFGVKNKRFHMLQLRTDSATNK